ncbi:MAG TPA: sulfotransferase domain-containing protein [Immundisolibacter sp.]|nr:sulfotransferase domain-containing protein [Immundisolibacter sp.]
MSTAAAPGYEFADVAERRRNTLAAMARTRQQMRPVTWLLRRVFDLSQVLGFEFPLFQRFFKPMASGLFDKAIAKAFTGYVPTEHDVFVCSYFKSGTNWAMHTAYQVAEHGEGEFEDILDVVPWVDCPDQETTVWLNDPRPQQRSRSGLRVIKTHARAQFVPYSDKARYICLVRDPKEVIVSGYHFFGSMLLGSLIPSVETWVRHCTSEQAVFHPWYEFTAGYWAWRERPNVLFLTYNELQDDPAGTIRRMADLMGVSLTEAEAQRVQHLSSFEHMKAIDHKFYPGEVSPFARPGGQMIRSGKKGNSGEMLTPAQQAHIDAWCKAGLAKLGSDFPYDRYFG